jgi:hypothetical protein
MNIIRGARDKSDGRIMLQEMNKLEPFNQEFWVIGEHSGYPDGTLRIWSSDPGRSTTIPHNWFLA